MEALESYGLISVVPVLVVIATAVITKRALEALFLGTFAAAAIIAVTEGVNWWMTWWGGVMATAAACVQYIVMFGMFGALIRMLDDSGAALGFADIGSKVANSRKKTLMFTWFLGILIFVEDYLNALGVGVAMQSLTDKWKISREYLAFVVNSTGAAVCILIPLSSWGALYSSQISETGIFDMSGIEAYTRSIPFMLYAWIAVFCVPLFVFGILPLFGPMKKAEIRAQETGRTFPDWHYEGESAEALETKVKPSSAWNFIIPMVALVIVVLVAMNLNWEENLGVMPITIGVIVATVVAFIMLWAQRIFKLGQFVDKTVDGFKDMLYVTVLVLIAFSLADFNDVLGLTPFVIQTVAPLLSPNLFPVIAFVVVALLAFATGSFWGVAAISFPIILPIAQHLDVNLFLAVGAVAAATSFGSHACFYSDAVTVTAAATGIKNIDYAKTSIPLIMVPFILAIIAYLIVGFIF